MKLRRMIRGSLLVLLLTLFALSGFRIAANAMAPNCRLTAPGTCTVVQCIGGVCHFNTSTQKCMCVSLP